MMCINVFMFLRICFGENSPIMVLRKHHIDNRSKMSRIWGCSYYHEEGKMKMKMKERAEVNTIVATHGTYRGLRPMTDFT